jgi:hypothetical protein
MVNKRIPEVLIINKQIQDARMIEKKTHSKLRIIDKNIQEVCMIDTAVLVTPVITQDVHRHLRQAQAFLNMYE